MKETNVKTGKVYLIDSETGDLIEHVPDGISIQITGTDLDKIGNVDISVNMKEEE